MELKEKPNNSSETKKRVFMFIGLVLVLAFVLVPVENRTYDAVVMDLNSADAGIIEREDIQITRQHPLSLTQQPNSLNSVENDITFKGEINPDAKKEIVVQEAISVQEAEIFLAVEDPPQFPGGETARHLFIINSTKYPKTAQAKHIQGTVYVTFVVEPNGSLSGIKVLKGIGGGCDEEAVRIVSIMPKWLPGKQKGQAVRVQINMPIKFALQ